MSQSITFLLRDGQEYMNLWPVRKELYGRFPECRVITATRFAIKVMPAMAVVATVMLYQLLGAVYLPQAIAVGAFFISLPLQGLFWLGHRASQPLPPTTRSWYQEIRNNMAKQGLQVARPPQAPRYMDLAALLRRAFDSLDETFTQRWL